MRNEVFDFKRFGAFAVRSWYLHGKKYLLHAGIFGGAMMLIMVMARVFNGAPLGYGDLDVMVAWFVFLVVAFFATFPVTVMKPFKNRHLLVMENMVPASTTEKWLFVLLNTTVVATIIYVVMLTVVVLTGMATSGSEPFVEFYRGFEWEDVWPALPLSLLVLVATMMFAGTMERRNHTVSFILIGVTAFAVFFMLTLFPVWLSDRFHLATSFGPMFSFDIAYAGSKTSIVRYMGDGIAMFVGNSGVRTVTWMSIGVAALLWLCAWFNFRERSIK